MKSLMIAAVLALTPAAALAQSATDLTAGVSRPEQVVNYGMGYGLQRFSPLAQIDKTSVKRLTPAWAYSLNDAGGQEGQAMVFDGVIYFATSRATVAVDALTGKQLWRTTIDYAPDLTRYLCCGQSARGLALYEGKLLRTTLDARVMALDLKTGKSLWSVSAADVKQGYSMTGAPMVAEGVLITGVAGAEYGTRDFIDGYDPNTGARLWRRYTVPAPGEPGSETWPKSEAYQRGGGSTWLTGSYDPQLGLLYWGVGNPGPWSTKNRPGDNLYTDTVLALKPKTGELVWHYQFTPNDPFDFDGANELIQADLTVAGKPRKVIMQANRNGFFYVLDRTNGKVLAANPFVKVNWADRIDLKTGRPVETELTRTARAGGQVEVWPSAIGGKNWPPMAYDPVRNLAFANTNNAGSVYKAADLPYRPGAMWTSTERPDFKYPDPERGFLKAIDPLTGKARWQHGWAIPSFSGVLATAGGLVFTGSMTGELMALDSDTGQVLWSFQTGSGLVSQPITWSKDGRQYVTVASGIGGLYPLAGGDERLASVPPGGNLWTFALLP